MRTLPILILSATLAAGPAVSGAVSFSSGWNEQRLSLFRSNDYRFGEQLGIVSDGAVSLAWKRLPRSEWQARSASWSWRVDQSVPPTDLGRKGGDDRNISLYFVFLPEAEANALEGANIRQLMGNDNVRILQYVWGGNHGRGQIIGSPYAPGQGVTVALRQAGTGAFSEQADLAADFRRAFGSEPGSLVGLAVSADSDDTDTAIRAAIGGLTLR
ncbi:DUF3047 domain-containing protein [Ponticoccus sp. SC2-23]|uniref:DUF3047 domain-containing protein n=1 Tax=Alexandriicola marinus TaxID=2081710 RepID=UPI000FDB212C|nr:DUF3047 domain-containing protein [Alexandriicola marinus]MBM1219650.1 DUF3047 domain-containing protein [Ponticoccus sp. SC6-9]MBM1223278.1 DUF3047 domain-containing protein [Ponticoccus sp. SC6-15]MBM1229463.1 DUF3047 domain-containing protein [Ponticoccus sp. SC6-38]MBM1232244.1 DUF3047 domain-containing protein [Ponticoccus sp. SC6-45]MBM1237806.1 DUF3047 domain-containing protein [Ponticoccus sp. SC6-49]MBM1241255.1 DUF3047 domain-containing protein [Ponticoccus sp. SC2-64]MBM1245768